MFEKKKRDAGSHTARQASSHCLTGRKGWKMFNLYIHKTWPMLLLTIFVNCIFAGPGRTRKMSLERWLIGSSSVIH